MTESLLEVRNLSVSFHADRQLLPVVQNLNLRIQPGETLALVGESGSGKSVTGLSIMQLLPKSAVISPASSILLQGKDLLTCPEIEMRKIRGRRIGLVFQEAITAFNPVLTIGAQILEVFSCHFRLTRRQKKSRAIHLLEEVGMPDPEQYLSAYPHELSGGLKQRAIIAMALAGEPDLLIADEPTTALDVTLQATVIHLLQELQQKRGMGMLFITHDLGLVYQIASQVVVLLKGEAVEMADAKTFFAQPSHPYSKKLFAAVPNWDAVVQRPRKAETKPLLSIENLKVYYPIRKGLFRRVVGCVKAVDGVSFTLNEGQTLALVGESGSGKTTTGMAILRLAPITAGHIQFHGHDLREISSTQLREDRKDFQVVFQDPYSSMNPRMLVRDILAEGMLAQKLYRSHEQCLRRITELLLYVGLPPEAQMRYPHEFSGGQRQRICIARALAIHPRLLICDEPTSALDVSAQMQVLKLLLKLQQDLNLSYLLITHNLGVVAHMADFVAVMYHGEIVEAGPTFDILNNPQQAYTKNLIAAVPQIPKSYTSHHKEELV